VFSEGYLLCMNREREEGNVSHALPTEKSALDNSSKV